MMTFTEDKSARLTRLTKRKPKKFIVGAVFLIVLASTLWLMQPKSHSPSSPSSSDGFVDTPPPTATNQPNSITGTVTGSDGRVMASASIQIADSNGNTVDSLLVDAQGHYQVDLVNGTYIFSINAKEQQLIQQVVIDPSSSKIVDVQLDVPGGQ